MSKNMSPASGAGSRWKPRLPSASSGSSSCCRSPVRLRARPAAPPASAAWPACRPASCDSAASAGSAASAAIVSMPASCSLRPLHARDAGHLAQVVVGDALRLATLAPVAQVAVRARQRIGRGRAPSPGLRRAPGSAPAASGSSACSRRSESVRSAEVAQHHVHLPRLGALRHAPAGGCRTPAAPGTWPSASAPAWCRSPRSGTAPKADASPSTRRRKSAWPASAPSRKRALVDDLHAVAHGRQRARRPCRRALPPPLGDVDHLQPLCAQALEVRALVLIALAREQLGRLVARAALTRAAPRRRARARRARSGARTRESSRGRWPSRRCAPSMRCMRAFSPAERRRVAAQPLHLRGQHGRAGARSLLP